MKPQRSSIKRVLYACIYSRDGLIAAFRSEAAFRQELALFFLLLCPLILLPFSPVTKMVLFCSSCCVLIAELLNSAVEAVVDLVSPHFHELARKAKDIGSAAVFISLVMTGTLWCYALFTLSQGH